MPNGLSVNVGHRAAAVDGVLQSGAVFADKDTLGLRRNPYNTTTQHSRRPVQLHSHRRAPLFRYDTSKAYWWPTCSNNVSP